jgi:hypothetical protein
MKILFDHGTPAPLRRALEGGDVVELTFTSKQTEL